MASRVRMALRFLFRSLDLRAAGFALALLAVAVGASVTTTALGIRADLGRKMTRELRAYGPNLLVGPPLGAPGASLPGDWPRRLEELAPEDAPVKASPLLLAGGTVAGVGAVLVGVEFDRARDLAPSWRVDGAWPGASPDACVLGAVVARETGAGPGDRVRVRVAGAPEAELLVAAVVHTGEAEDEQARVPLGWLQDATGNPGRISAVAAMVDGGPDAVASYARTVEEASGGTVEARPLLQVSRAQGALLGKLDLMMLLLTGVVLLLAGMCVMTTLMSIVVERESEIGLMRSMGASDGEVMRMLLGEATLLGFTGGLLGLAVGIWDARWIGRQVFGTAVAFRPDVVPWVLLATLGLCWLAVLLPMRRALRVLPAAALRGE